jgi:hypothetical protein
VNVVRQAAMILSAAAFGISLTLTITHAIILRFNRSEFGWHTISGMVLVTALFLAIRLGYTGWPGADALLVACLALIVPMAAWRASFLLRPPPPPPDDRPSSP